jgi:hypothetical protein
VFTAKVLSEYRSTLLQWGEALEAGKVARANRLFDRNHRQFKRLREAPEGREGIAALMEDEHPRVRLVAATHSLLWVPDRALEVLEQLKTDRKIGVDAEYTIKEWQAGSLSLDW